MCKYILIISFILLITNGVYAEIDEKSYEPDSAAYNDVCYMPPDKVYCAIVSEDGWVRIRRNYGAYSLRSRRVSTEHILTSVSFATSDTGWVVGYKRDSTSSGLKWEGAIWKTNDQGDHWTRQTNITPQFNIPTPFLQVSAISGKIAWISCGNGEVLKTSNYGNTWIRLSKPGGAFNYNWFWGLWAYNESIAWVCADQSGN